MNNTGKHGGCERFGSRCGTIRAEYRGDKRVIVTVNGYSGDT